MAQYSLKSIPGKVIDLEDPVHEYAENVYACLTARTEQDTPFLKDMGILYPILRTVIEKIGDPQTNAVHPIAEDLIWLVSAKKHMGWQPTTFGDLMCTLSRQADQEYVRRTRESMRDI